MTGHGIIERQIVPWLASVGVLWVGVDRSFEGYAIDMLKDEYMSDFPCCIASYWMNENHKLGRQEINTRCACHRDT